jgi:hypothetical protein
MPYLPTDLDILNQIFKDYYKEATTLIAQGKYGDEVKTVKEFISIDIIKIADELGTEPAIVFSRLHKHAKVDFFRLRPVRDVPGKDHTEINFPHMCSLLAEMRQQHEQFRSNYLTAVLSAVFAAISAVGAIVPIIRERSEPPAIAKPAPAQKERQEVDPPKTDGLVTPAKKQHDPGTPTGDRR